MFGTVIAAGARSGAHLILEAHRGDGPGVASLAGGACQGDVVGGRARCP